MPKTPQVRTLNDIRSKDAKLAEGFDDLIRAHGTIAEQLSSDPNGSDVVPSKIGQLLIQSSGPLIDVSIVHNGPLSRAIHYYLEYDTDPNFSNPRVRDMGQSRNAELFLPNGIYFFQVRPQYPAGGPPADPVRFPGRVVVTGSQDLKLFPSQGAGTGGGGAGKTVRRGLIK